MRSTLGCCEGDTLRGEQTTATAKFGGCRVSSSALGGFKPSGLKLEGGRVMERGGAWSGGVTSCHPRFPRRRPEESVSEIPVLPREVLQVLSQRLGQCVAQVPREEGGGASLGQALLLLKFFIIICRWVTAHHHCGVGWGVGPGFPPTMGVPGFGHPGAAGSAPNAARLCMKCSIPPSPPRVASPSKKCIITPPEVHHITPKRSIYPALKHSIPPKAQHPPTKCIIPSPPQSASHPLGPSTSCQPTEGDPWQQHPHEAVTSVSPGQGGGRDTHTHDPPRVIPLLPSHRQDSAEDAPWFAPAAALSPPDPPTMH